MAVIVVLRALGLGDLLTAVPALRALRRAYPREHIRLAAPAGLAPIARLTGAVDDILPTPSLGGGAAPAAPVRLAVNLHGRGPDSIDYLTQMQPADLLTHRHPNFPQLPGLQWRDGLHEVDRWCRLMEFAGLPADRADLFLPAPDTESPWPRAVVIHPGAGSAARRWPVERFAAVARQLAARNLPVVVTGSTAERPLAAAVAHRAELPNRAVLAGRLDLDGLAAVVHAARLVVCGDTGVGHLATAYGTPSVLLFGPTPPRVWGPPPDRKHRVLWVGDVGDPHAGAPDPGLLLLSTRLVLQAVLAQLDDFDGAERTVAH